MRRNRFTQRVTPASLLCRSFLTGGSLEFHGFKIAGDAGLLVYRKLDEFLSLTDLAGMTLSDLQRDENTRHVLTGLLQQSVNGRLT